MYYNLKLFFVKCLKSLLKFLEKTDGIKKKIIKKKYYFIIKYLTIKKQINMR